jgi:hypothetical protein
MSVHDSAAARKEKEMPLKCEEREDCKHFASVYTKQYRFICRCCFLKTAHPSDYKKGEIERAMNELPQTLRCPTQVQGDSA